MEMQKFYDWYSETANPVNTAVHFVPAQEFPDKAQCRHCGSFFYANNVYNMYRHLYSIHVAPKPKAAKKRASKAALKAAQAEATNAVASTSGASTSGANADDIVANTPEDGEAVVPVQTGRASGLQPAPTPGSTPALAGNTRRVPMKVLAPKPKSPQPPPPPPEVCLRWNSYHSNMQATFPALLTSQRYVDVTLACEGSSIQCHKLILSACSSYFDELLSQNPCQHPIVLMKDLKFWEIQALVDFMYRGEVNVSQDKLPSLLAAAEALQIKGLAGPASVPGPSAHDQPDDGLNPVLDDFLADHVDVGNNVMAALGVAQPPARRVRRRRVIEPAPNVEPSVPAKPSSAAASANTSANANQNASAGVSPGHQQRSVLSGRKRKIEPLPQPMRIKVEPVDDPGTEDDEDRFTIDTSAEDADQADSSTTGQDNTFEDDISPLLPEVVMAPDPAAN